MKSGIFTIDIFKDLDYKGRVSLAKSTSNREILIVLSETPCRCEYVKGQVVQNINTPIYILTKMLKEYDKVPWLERKESFYSGYTKENILKTLKLIKKKLGKDKFEETVRIENLIYERFAPFNL